MMWIVWTVTAAAAAAVLTSVLLMGGCAKTRKFRDKVKHRFGRKKGSGDDDEESTKNVEAVAIGQPTNSKISEQVARTPTTTPPLHQATEITALTPTQRTATTVSAFTEDLSLENTQRSSASDKERHHTKTRSRLPAKMRTPKALTWRQLMGIAVHGIPISQYEPTSTLQILVEEMRFATELLGAASKESDAARRAMFVATFAIASVSHSATRTRKPFAPLIGETFDYRHGGWTLHAEQVSHKPDISALIAESENWKWEMTAHMVVHQSGTSFSVESKLPVRVTLFQCDSRKEEEVYEWKKVNATIDGLTSTTRELVVEGQLELTKNGTRTGIVNFHADEREIDGEIFDERDNVAYHLSGRWNEFVCCDDPTTKKKTVVWTNSIDPNGKHYYGFSAFSFGLNELHASELPSIPPTDSRLRPDIRALEDGRSEVAEREKKRLEAEQRKRASCHQSVKPIWFEKQADGQWISNKKYWRSKKKHFACEPKPFRLFKHPSDDV